MISGVTPQEAAFCAKLVRLLEGERGRLSDDQLFRAVHALLAVAIVEVKGDPAGRFYLRELTDQFVANYKKPVLLGVPRQ